MKKERKNTIIMMIYSLIWIGFAIELFLIQAHYRFEDFLDHILGDGSLSSLIKIPESMLWILIYFGGFYALFYEAKKFIRQEVDRFKIQSIAPFPFSVKDLSSVVPAIQNQPSPNIKKGMGGYSGYNWHSFMYSNTPHQLNIKFLANTEIDPIQVIWIDLAWTNEWKEKLLPICIDQIVSLVNAITENTPDGLEQLRKGLNKIRRQNYKSKTKVITLEIISTSSDERFVNGLVIYNSQKVKKTMK